ncbi:hypothetical protein PQO03_18440 [Lentisphaera profundi]|uniref:Uncharacterized protein n=1 Tax=Lentisphaera profundi TaxID=1658616 RepID=A0ABY7VYM2_9BACT|nr:hypothetical protein [Lentisphaera profundi]WDE97809.1 hypothetical protein PQO03_18440 [Lentisphaera profundi]
MIQINDKLIPVDQDGRIISVDLGDYQPVLEASFKKCGFHDVFLIDDILVAMSLFARNKIVEKDDLDHLLYRVLIDNGLTDVAAHYRGVYKKEIPLLPERIKAKLSALDKDFDEVILVKIEQRIDRAAYVKDDLSDVFIHALCLEELRLSKIEQRPYRLGEGLLMPNQSFRSVLNFSADQVNWKTSQLQIDSGGYLFQSIHLEVFVDEILHDLSMPPLLDLVFYEYVEDLCEKSVIYLEKALGDYLKSGGEYDYLSVKVRSIRDKELRKVFKKSCKKGFERILKEKYRPFADLSRLVFHLD